MAKESNASRQKWYRLSDRLAITMSAGPLGISCEWDPDIPVELTDAELEGYRKARAEMLDLLAEYLGGRVAVVELDGTEGPS